MKNIQNLISYKFIFIFVASHPLPPKMVMSSHKRFFIIFSTLIEEHLGHQVFLLESILICKKILWSINFVLIKFSPNATLCEKLQNNGKNPLFLMKVTCIRSDP